MATEKKEGGAQVFEPRHRQVEAGMKAVWAGIVVVALIAVGAVATINYERWFVFPEMRTQLLKHLSDPASAQFRDERISQFGWLCGEVNSKNRQGGYVGFKRFMADSAGETHLEEHGRLGLVPESHRTVHAIRRLEKSSELLRVMLQDFQSGKRNIANREQAVADVERLVDEALFQEAWGLNCRGRARSP